MCVPVNRQVLWCASLFTDRSCDVRPCLQTGPVMCVPVYRQVLWCASLFTDRSCDVRPCLQTAQQLCGSASIRWLRTQNNKLSLSVPIMFTLTAFSPPPPPTSFSRLVSVSKTVFFGCPGSCRSPRKRRFLFWPRLFNPKEAPKGEACFCV